MFKTSYNEADLLSTDNDNKPVPTALIQDWYDLAPHLNLQPYQLSYAKRNKTDMQHKIVLKKGKETRVVYQSSGTLQRVQNRLKAFLCSMENDVLGDAAIAYRKGVNPIIDVIDKLEHSRYLVTFDIVKYYDHVNYKHIKETLMDMGFPRLGSQLISNYTTVKRRVGKDKHVISTLQQGSKTSPVISNLVGNKYIDRVIQAWIDDTGPRYPDISLGFLRYSDNIALSVDAPDSVAIPIELIQNYKQYIKEALAKTGFRTHKWSTIPRTHPKRNQQFLGVVLNKKARIDNVKFDEWRATLFNACRSSLRIAAEKYYQNCAEEKHIDPRDVHSQVELFVMVMKGRISYLKSISKVQHGQLEKLMRAAEVLNSSEAYTRVIVDRSQADPEKKDWISLRTITKESVETFKIAKEEVLNAVKTYKRKEESLEVYLSRLKDTLGK
jgi:hypothetical protein